MQANDGAGAPIRINEVVRAAMDRAAPTLPAGVRPVLRLSPRILTARFPARDLERILRTLIANACDAMPAGGELVVETFLEQDRDAPSFPGSRASGPAAIVSVSDSAQGFGGGEAVPGPGVELDLFAIRWTVERAGGTIRTWTEPGAGSRILVSLPHVDPLAAPAPAAERAAPPAPRACILVVEDEDELRELVATILDSERYQVLTAASAEQALELAQRQLERIDLLLTDIVLPGVNGVLLARRLRELRLDLPVVFMTAHPDVLDARRASVASHVPCLRKPFRVADLLTAVAAALPAAGRVVSGSHTEAAAPSPNAPPPAA